MAYPQGFQKAQLTIDADKIECGFNPQDYTISKTNIWSYKPTQGTDRPDAEFGGGMPMSYKLSLLLDSSLDGPDASIKDQANKLMEAMHGKGSAPKLIQFSWGSVKLPKAAPVTMSIHYVLFHPNGEPVRAFVDLELAQAEDATPAGQAQNPTTRAIAGLRSHIVREGDTLPSLAYEAYGDATQWRAIAEANGIDNPLHLRRGTALTIPRIDG
jgi:phage tail protein X